MADSTPLQEARLLSPVLSGLLTSFPWPPPPGLPVLLDVMAQPPSQARVDTFSVLDTQSLIVRFRSPAQGLLSHDDDAVFEDAVAPVSLPEEKLELLPMDMFPVELPFLKLSLFSSDSLLLASRSAAATSILYSSF